MSAATNLAVNDAGIAILCGKDLDGKFITNFIDFGLILETKHT
jgi:hypothetical protein